MSVQAQITRLSDAKEAIKAAIEERGVAVPSDTKLDGMAILIYDIPAGVDTSEDTVTAGSMLSGITAHDASGAQITGTIATKTSSNMTANGATVTAPAGYYATSQSKSVSTATQATPSISVSTAGLITASATQSAGYVSSGTKSATKQLTTQAAKTVTPSASSQTAVASGVYTTGAVTVSGDSNLVAGNIKSGTKIFGVAGTYTGPTVNYKQLTITVSADAKADTLIATDATIGAQRSNAALEISLVPNFQVATANYNVVRAFNSNKEVSPAQAPAYGACVKLTGGGINESTTLILNALNGSSAAGGIRVANTRGQIYFRASSTTILKSGTYTLRATW